MPLLQLNHSFSLTSAALIGAGVLGVLLPVQAAEVIAGPTGQPFKVASLPDGNYRFCSDRPPSDIDRVSGVCFRFRKVDDQITGDYYYPYEGSSVCLTGRVNGNTVSGQGLERIVENASPPQEVEKGQFTNWRQEGYLQVRRGIVFDQLPREGEAIRYRSALLNLNDFYQYNAGTVLPPTDCFSPATRSAGSRPEPDNLRELGMSEFYDRPVYLDEGSITPVGDNAYRYRTIIGVPNRLSETEYRVDCDRLETVQVLRSRYYDSDGDLQEVEVVNDAVPANQDNPPSTRRYNASQYICSTDAQGI
ncbi:hypothetical protein C7271_08045 [filamentous cyanobacterium CCP5]|nr:hypothetical protein C7271_08045 [filamentous cyanobacterium CCP5]